MRVPDTDPVGRIGLEETKADFSRLKWGANENMHDVGTDLLIAVRDTRGFDLGILVGAQVKSGPSWFSEPTVPPNPAGWWFRSDQRHIDYWLGYNAAHLIILHDNDARISYYEHITSATVVLTQRQSKILVPAENRIDIDHRDALLKIAGTGRSKVPLEGTAWTGASPAVLADRFRFALIVPRLLAPHPNHGVTDPLTPEVAVALMMQARFSEVDLNRSEPKRRGSRTTTEPWRWSLTRAFKERLFGEDPGQLRSRMEDAPDTAGLVVATVMYASAQLEAGNPQAACEAIEQTLALDTAAPVDDAWLRLQHARALVQIGQVVPAREEARRAYSIRDVAHHDVTATAISGVAATILFNTADWGARDLGGVIQDGDTAVTWWRNETGVRGANAALERQFKDWTHDTSVTIGGADQARNQLLVAGLAASHLGAHGAWAHFSSLLGRDSLLRLDRFAKQNDVVDGLRDLRLAGDDKALRLAGRRILEDGPSAALREAASEVRMDATTTSTVFSDLAMLKAAGDVLDHETARAASDWLTAALEQPPDILASSRTGRAFAVEPTLVEHLTAAVAQTPAHAVELAIRFVPSVPDVEDPLVEHAWGRFLDQIPPEAWSVATAGALEPISRQTNGRLRTAIRQIRVRFDAAARHAALDELKSGSLSALETLGDVAKIPSDATRGITDSLTERLLQERNDAARGRPRFGGVDVPKALAIILSFHPDEEAVGSLLSYLSDRAVPRSLKRGALQTIILNSEHLSEAWKAEIPKAIAGTELPSGAPEVPFEQNDISAEVALLMVMFGDAASTEAASYMASLLAGNDSRRMWACRLAASEGHENLTSTLAILISDSVAAVRASAAASLVTITETGRGDSLTATALGNAVADPGILVPVAIASEAARSRARWRTVDDLLTRLQAHHSATVRLWVSRATEARRPPG